MKEKFAKIGDEPLSEQKDLPMVIRHPIPGETPLIVTQPGWDMADITCLKEITHVKSGTPALLTDLVTLPQLRTGWHDYADLKLASPTKHWKISKTDAKVGKIDFLWELECQAETMNYGWASMKDTTMPAQGADTALITLFFADMKTALTERDPIAIKADRTAITTLADFINGFGFKKVKSLGVCTDTLQGLKSWFRRWVYACGYMWSASFPKMNERFESMTEAQINRVVYDFLIAAIYALNDFFIIAAAQSERAMFNLGFLETGLVSKKVPETLKTAIDSYWNLLMDRSKKTVSVGDQYDQYVDNHLNVTLVSGSTLEDAFKETETPWMVSDVALKLARQMFGIGLHDKGQKTHFAILLDLANGVDTSSTPDVIAPLTSAYHGVSTWVLGQNLSIVLKYLEGVALGRSKIWMDNLSKKTHWTYTDMTNFGKTIFTGFTFKGSLSGLAENSAYPGNRATVHFLYTENEGKRTTPWPLVESWFSDPQMMVSTNDMKIDALAITSANVIDMPCAPWIYLFALQNRLANKRWSIYCYHDWTEQEFIFWLRWGLLWSREFDDQGDDDHWYGYATRNHMCEVVESHTKERLGLIRSKLEDIRTASVAAAVDNEYKTESIKYICTVIDTTKAVDEISNNARPKGIDALYPTIIDNLSRNYKNCQDFIRRIMMPPVAVTQEAKSEAPKQADKPPVAPTPAVPTKTEEEDDAA